MSWDVNDFQFTGRLTKDCTEILKENGTFCVFFKIAVNRPARDAQTNERTTTADFFPFYLYGDKAKSYCSHLKKGQLIFISGRLRLSVRIVNNIRNEKPVFDVDRILFLGKKPENKEIDAKNDSEASDLQNEEDNQVEGVEGSIEFEGVEFEN
ncbi:MAG: single-stranded DNA-binding protein [Spirochaetaceae bacterium]|jgi:single-stranded DNA-binding protein|nr:single-stranded DNA-binding protein [Spirochaetaceae bacterium]